MKTKKELKEKLTAAEPADFIGEERGQISVLLLLGLIPLIFLVALIVNTANQTTKKIQLQGAADASVISGAIWEARGMNLIALNNNSMAEVLSLMIVIRSLRVTRTLTPMVAAALAAATFGALSWLVPPANAGASFSTPIVFIDRTFNSDGGVGWKALNILDKFNQAIRKVIPGIALAATYSYGRQNHATFSLLMTNQNFSLRNFEDLSTAKSKLAAAAGDLANFLTPTLPVNRNSPRFIAERASECQLARTSKLRLMSMAALIPYTVAAIIAAPIYQLMIELSLAELTGSFTRDIEDRFRSTFRSKIPSSGILGRIFRSAIRRALSLIFSLLDPLKWSRNPPMPMLLSDTPGANPRTKKEEDMDLKKVRKYLQFLSLTFDEREQKSPIGGTRFPNESALFLPNTQLAYAQAEVYNPTKWSLFSQDWRAKLAKATVFDEKFTDWSFVNNH